MTTSELPASVQFYDNLPTIEAMLERRFSLRRIWQTLTDEGKYTGDYTHFCRLAKKEFGGKKLPSNKPRVNTKPSAPRIKEERVNTQTESSAPEEEDDDDGPLMYMDDLASPKKK